MTSHTCTGPECWICGEPEELRRVRFAIAKAFLNKNEYGLKFTECSTLARIAMRAIRQEFLESRAVLSDAEVERDMALRELGEIRRAVGEGWER